MVADQHEIYLRNLDLIRLRDDIDVAEHIQYGDIARADLSRGERALTELGMNRVLGAYRKAMKARQDQSPF
jgi:hypothetical protein